MTTADSAPGAVLPSRPRSEGAVACSFKERIEEAVVSVHPKGIYMEVGHIPDVLCARGVLFCSAQDTLEVEYFFSLPDGAVVTDSWLWVEDVIIRADIQDAWTAQETYENIVRRRRDPSILYKRGPELL